MLQNALGNKHLSIFEIAACISSFEAETPRRLYLLSLFCKVKIKVYLLNILLIFTAF
jgi:hypothetical protein